MKITKLIKYYLLGKSIKDIELNKILNKVRKDEDLTEREENFLRLYKSLNLNLNKDFMLLSKNTTFQKIEELLESNIKVVCNLHDRDGEMDDIIIGSSNEFDEDVCYISLKSKITKKLEDRFLYNLIYNDKREYYSLTSHDEYFEKIEIEND